jgi:hypothetical protein
MAEKSKQPSEDKESPAKDSAGVGVKEPPVTEKPVESKKKISKFLVSVDDSNGVVVKIEKLDEKTNKYTELTPDEYGAAYAAASYSAPYYAAQAASMYDPLDSPEAQYYLAYLKAISDYVQSINEK